MTTPTRAGPTQAGPAQAAPSAPGTIAVEIRTMLVVGLAHGCSHFFQLVLPPLFPFLIVDFATNYTELGLTMTLFFLVSGIGQPISGFLVDRFGARILLMLGLALYSTAILALSFTQSLASLVLFAALAGAGNAVFHPVDFTILNRRISQQRLGRAFGLHTLGGNLGWAAAPALMIFLAGWYDWRLALQVAAVIGLVIWVICWRYIPTDRDTDLTGEVSSDKAANSSHHTTHWAILLQAPILLSFVFFTLLAAGLIGVQNFLVPTLAAQHQTPIQIAATALTGFLIGASVGVVIGGILADRLTRHTALIAFGLAGAACLILMPGYFNLPASLLIIVLFCAGLMSGLITPSRDLLVRSATPKGATGRVYGFAYSGLDVGSALAPAVIGLLLDREWTFAVFVFIAVAFAMGIATAFTIRNTTGRNID